MQPLIGQGWTRSEVQIVPSAGTSFEEETWACFHHPAIPLPEKIPLTEAPSVMSRKAFVTHPGPILDEVTDSVMENLAASMMNEISQSMDEDVDETPLVEEVIAEPKPETAPKPIPMTEENLPPVTTPQPESPLESELRQVISLLVAGGQEMGDIMEHPQFIEVSERAAAAGVDVWGMFVRISEES